MKPEVRKALHEVIDHGISQGFTVTVGIHPNTAAQQEELLEIVTGVVPEANRSKAKDVHWVSFNLSPFHPPSHLDIFGGYDR